MADPVTFARRRSAAQGRARTQARPALGVDLRAEPPGALHLVNGMRGTGRETLTARLEQELLESSVPAHLILHTDLLDLRTQIVGGEALARAVNGYLTRTPEARRTRFYLLVGNIENAPGWQQPLGHLLNAYDVVVVATAACESWSFSRAAGTLPAQARLHCLHPRGLGYESLFSPEELAVEPPSHLTAQGRDAFESYLRNGGLTVHGAGPLQDLLRLSVADDVVSRNPTFSYPLCMACAIESMAATGENLSVSHLTGQIGKSGISTTRATVSRMLGALEEAQLIHLSGEFSRAGSTNARMSRVVYAGDHGLARACAQGGELESIDLMRTVVYNELRRRGARDVCYYRTNARNNVHFAWGDAQAGRVEHMLHVTTGSEGSKRFERSLGILAAGMAEADVGRATLLCPADETTLHRRGKTTDVMPLWEWIVRR